MAKNENDENELLPNNAHSRTFSTGSQDEVNETGSIAGEIPVGILRNGSTNVPILTTNMKWKLNYQEAAIFIQEGENNDKFYNHPQNQDALPAYQISHNPGFYLLDLAAAFLLMFLALCERPAVSGLQLQVAVHGSLEILGIAVLALELFLKMRWIGVKTFIKHKRTMFKAGLLTVMLIEAVVVIIRQANHFRVTRALRPVFLMDSYYCKGVRRFVRQILQSLPPILDMIALLLFFMLIFSILGFYLFSQQQGDLVFADNYYFRTIEDSFINLFILLTTANFPDVMMPSYARNKASAIFFIIYLAIELYFLMNLLLAVVYDTFNNIEKVKLKNLYLHKRKACQYAFKLLVSRQNPNTISLHHFMGFMRFYIPRKSRKDIYLCFKFLNQSKTGKLSLEEFYQVYEVTSLSWKSKQVGAIWSTHFYFPLNKIFRGINKFVSWVWFDYLIYVIIAINFVWILVETIQISVNPNKEAQADYHTTWYSIIFSSVYGIEAILKIVGLGPKKYFNSGWNIFDFIITVSAIVGILGELVEESFYYIVVLRPFRLLRLFKARERFRDVLGTMIVLINRLGSLAVVMVLLYYFFGIIGMEVFSHYHLKDCCKNTTVEDFYKTGNGSDHLGYYYLNNFDNILISGVTLFELTVVNNWFIIMEGYANVATGWSRIYFMLFYLVTMVVMNIVVAFILEAFIFRIQYRRTMNISDIDDHGLMKVDVCLSCDEVQMCLSTDMPLTGYYLRQEGEESTTHAENFTLFRGERLRSKEDFSLRMYRDEVTEWITEQERRSTLHVTSPSRNDDSFEELDNSNISIQSIDTEDSQQIRPVLKRHQTRELNRVC